MAGNYGVSTSTVRAALAILAADGLIDRRRGSGTYVSDTVPAFDRTTGVLFHGNGEGLLRQSFAREIFRGILNGTENTTQQVHLVLGRERLPIDVTSRHIESLGLERFNSLICLEVFNEDLLDRLARRIVTVSVDSASRRPAVSSIAIAHQESVRQAVDLLWLMGHRRIAFHGFSASSPDPARVERMTGYLEAMKAHGLSIDPAWETQRLADPIEKVLRLDQPADHRPTAIVCPDQEWQVIEVLTRKGLRVPQDFSVVGLGVPTSWMDYFRGHALRLPEGAPGAPGQFGDPLDPQLAPLRSMVVSIVALPFFEMGQWAMREVLRRLSRRDATPAKETIQSRVMPGNTVAPPPG